MRKIIAAMQVSLDGFIEGPNGEIDWVETWADHFGLLHEIDTCILGGGMYPGYEQYWLSILNDPEAPLPFSGKVASKGEIAYAHFADRTPHLVLSTTLDQVTWKTARIIRDMQAIGDLKRQPGKHIHAVGGATLVGGLINIGLLDELRLVVHPVVLGAGKALFKDVTSRHAMKLLRAEPLASGEALLTFGTRAAAS